MRANESTRHQPATLLLLGTALVLLCGAATWLETINPIEPRSLVTFRTPEEARGIAVAKNRLMLFVFVAQRDLESATLEREMLTDGDVVRKLDRDFVVVRVVDHSNAGVKNDAATSGLIAQFNVGVFPTLVMSDPDGVRAIPSPRYRGVRRAMTFLEMGERYLRKTEGKRIDPEAVHRHERIEALSRIGGVSSPSFSPDGERIAFVSDLSGQSQLWTMSADGGFPEQVTTLPDGAAGAQWSPDGKWISFVSPPPGTGAPQVFVVRPDGSDMRRLTADRGERNICGFWTRDSKLPISTIRRTSTTMECALFDPESGAGRVVASTPQFGLIIDVSCDGRRALLLRRDGNLRALWLIALDASIPPRPIFPPADEETIGGFECDRPSSVQSSSIQSSSILSSSTLATSTLATSTLASSTLATSILATSNARRDRAALLRISIAPTSFGRTETLWSRDDAELSGSVTSRDGARIAAVWQRDGADELWVRDSASGASRRLALPVDTIAALRFAPDGRRLLLAGSSAQAPSNLYIVDVANGRTRRLTGSPHPGVDLMSLVAPQLVRFRGADGLPLSGWLYRAAKPGAAVVSIHGGPMQQESPALNATYQALLSAGISVFAPNVRGSAGFGRRFLGLDDGARRFDAIADVKAAADYLVANRIAAPEKIGIMGESYGGWMSLAAATAYPSLFAAAVDEFGMTDLTRMADEMPDLAAMHRAEFGDDRALLERLSPLANADRLRTPTLILHGAHDSQVPEWHSSRLVAKLRAQRAPVDYILFPDEGHIFRKEANRIRATAAITDWFTKRLLL